MPTLNNNQFSPIARAEWEVFGHLWNRLVSNILRVFSVAIWITLTAPDVPLWNVQTTNTYFYSALYLHSYYINMVLRGQDAWRSHPLYLNLWKNPFPGLKPAVLVFSSIVAAEYAYKYITIGPPNPRKGHWWF